MNEAVLVIDEQSGGAELAKAAGPVFHWARRDVPESHFSVPALVDEKLIELRRAHESWAYELAGLSAPFGLSIAQALGGSAQRLSMWWTSLLYERHPRLLPGLYQVYKLQALALALAECGAGGLCAIGADRQTSRALASLCSQSGLAYRKCGRARLRLPGLPSTRSIYMLLPAPLRAAIRYVHWLLTVRRRLTYAGAPDPRAQNAPPDATIFTYFPNIDLQAAGRGRFRSRYWEGLQDALNAQAVREGGHFVRWVFIRFPSPELDFAQCLKLRDIFRQKGHDGLSFNYLEEFLRTRDLLLAIGRYARIALGSLLCQARAKRAFRLAGSAVDFWPQLGWAYAESFRGWRCLERCLQDQAFLNHSRLGGRQRWRLFPLENCPWERMLCHAVHGQKESAGPLFGAQHSSIRRTDFRYFDDPRTFSDARCRPFQPDAVRANGLSALRQWRQANVPESLLGQVEALRYLYLAGSTPASAISGAGAPEAKIGHGRRLLILTSFFRRETEEHLRLFASALKEGLLDGWEIIIRPHPCLPVRDLLEKLLGRRIADDLNYSEGPLASELVPGVTVWTSNSTTAALEAAILGLPLLVMQASDDFDLCPIQDLPQLARTSSLRDLAQALRDPRPLRVPEGYLDLDRGLPRWKALLGLCVEGRP